MTQQEAMNMSNEQAVQILIPLRNMMCDQNGCPISDAVFALDKAIEAINRVEELEKLFAEMLEQAKSESKDGDWIPVSERLPEKDGDYLAQYRTGSMDVLSWTEGWNCHRDNDGAVVRNNEMKSIVAWMELPKPYKESDGE